MNELWWKVQKGDMNFRPNEKCFMSLKHSCANCELTFTGLIDFFMGVEVDTTQYTTVHLKSWPKLFRKYNRNVDLNENDSLHNNNNGNNPLNSSKWFQISYCSFKLFCKFYLRTTVTKCRKNIIFHAFHKFVQAWCLYIHAPIKFAERRNITLIVNVVKVHKKKQASRERLAVDMDMDCKDVNKQALIFSHFTWVFICFNAFLLILILIKKCDNID